LAQANIESRSPVVVVIRMTASGPSGRRSMPALASSAWANANRLPRVPRIIVLTLAGAQSPQAESPSQEHGSARPGSH
jgi:hypothetical protein